MRVRAMHACTLESQVAAPAAQSHSAQPSQGVSAVHWVCGHCAWLCAAPRELEALHHRHQHALSMPSVNECDWRWAAPGELEALRRRVPGEPRLLKPLKVPRVHTADVVGEGALFASLEDRRWTEGRGGRRRAVAARERARSWRARERSAKQGLQHMDGSRRVKHTGCASIPSETLHHEWGLKQGATARAAVRDATHA